MYRSIGPSITISLCPRRPPGSGWPSALRSLPNLLDPVPAEVPQKPCDSEHSSVYHFQLTNPRSAICHGSIADDASQSAGRKHAALTRLKRLGMHLRLADSCTPLEREARRIEYLASWHDLFLYESTGSARRGGAFGSKGAGSYWLSAHISLTRPCQTMEMETASLPHGTIWFSRSGGHSKLNLNSPENQSFL